MSDPQQLIAAYLDNTLAESEGEELKAWLKAHPDHLRALVEASIFEQQIRSAVVGAVQRETAGAFVPAEAAARSGHRRGTTAHWLRAFVRRRFGWAIAAAIVLLLTLMGVGRWMEKPSADASPSFARVTRARSAEVPGQGKGIQPGQTLDPGRFTLVAGAVEITLRNGVTMVFEGPGDLELLTPMRVWLHSGQVVVRVPENARGFQVETPGANIVDLGTEFAVKAGPGLTTDVQVYEGVVINTPRPTAVAGSFPQRLTAGNARRFTPGPGRAPQVLAYAPERFVRRLPADEPIEHDEPASPLFNFARHEEIIVSRSERPPVIDGDLSDWSEAHIIQSVRNEAAGEFIEGRMRYDDEYLYLSAHIGDPVPLRNVVDPDTDGELGWRGGGLQVRLSTNPALGWPVEGNSAAYYTMRRLATDEAQVAKATDSSLVHLTLWHHAPTARDCLHLAFGMDFHDGQVNPPGYRAAYRRDADGRGYTLEYALPWRLLKAPGPPRPGDTLGMSWTVHWSDEGGRLWRGQWVELRNAAEPLRIHTWERAATWGRARFQ